MMTPDEIIAIVQAKKDGAEIEYRYLNCDDTVCLGRWSLCPESELWDFRKEEYRIAPPKPREWMLSVGRDGKIIWPLDVTERLIKVREVIEE